MNIVVRDKDRDRQALDKMAGLGYKFEKAEAIEELGAALQESLQKADWRAFNELIGEPFDKTATALDKGVDMATVLGGGAGGHIYSAQANVASYVLQEQVVAPNEPIWFPLPRGGQVAYWLAEDGHIRNGYFESKLNVAETYPLVTEAVELGYFEISRNPLSAAERFAQLKLDLGRALDVKKEEAFFDVVDAAVPDGTAQSITKGRPDATKAGTDYISQTLLSAEDHYITGTDADFVFDDFKSAVLHLSHHDDAGNAGLRAVVVPNDCQLDLASWTADNIQLFAEGTVDNAIQTGGMPKLLGAQFFAHSGKIYSEGSWSDIVSSTKVYLFANGVGYMPYRRLPSGRRRDILVTQGATGEANKRLVYQFAAVEDVGIVIANPYKTAIIELQES